MMLIFTDRLDRLDKVPLLNQESLEESERNKGHRSKCKYEMCECRFTVETRKEVVDNYWWMSH